MIIDRTKERLIHAMVFFIKKTMHCYALKLFHLLYFLDFEHFRQTGRPVTGMEYFAWKTGPAPRGLYDELKTPGRLKKFFAFIPEQFSDSDFANNKDLRLRPKINFDKSLFSKREMGIMNHLADLYKNAKPKDMAAAGHDKKGPWQRALKEKARPRQIIPYEHALDNSPGSVSKEEAGEIAGENAEMRRMFKFESSV